MRRMAGCFRAASVGLFAVGLAAQARPDFSGRWTSEPEPAAVTTAAGGGQGGGGAARGAGGGQRGAAGQGGRGRSGDMGSGWGSNLTIAQDASRLTVEYMFFSRGDMQPPLRFIYALDGSETKNSVMMGQGIQVQPSKAKWDGEKLVIVTVHTLAHPETGRPLTTEVTQTLSLESPASLVVDATRSGVLGGPSSATRTVYRKY